MNGALRIGTRGSALALAQVTLVARALEQHGVASETVVIETAGDMRAPDTAWGEGAFVGAIEDALLDGRVDVAVHSAKDVPTDEHPRLAIRAFLPREEPRDALVLRPGITATLATLPPGTVVGTDSPRRTGFVRAQRPDLDVRPLHGNVDTRLRRLDDGAVDALVLAAAGLIRLGRGDRITELLPAEVVPPAPGQGAIAVQVRVDDSTTAAAVAGISHPPTRAAVEAEREFLAATGGGCRSPIGALADASRSEIVLLGASATLDGRTTVMDRIAGDGGSSLSLARQLAQRIVERRAAARAGPRVLVTRAPSESRHLASRLAEHGIAAVVVPAVDTELLDVDAASVDGYDMVVATSANAVRAVARVADVRRTCWAAVGSATARELRSLGASDVWLPSRATAAAVADELPVRAALRVLRLRGDLVDDSLSVALRERGAHVDELTVYRTVVAPEKSRAVVERTLADGGAPAAVVFASPSAVRGLLELATDARRPDILRLPAIAIGPTTAAAARESAFSRVVTADAPDADSVAEAVVQTLGVPELAH